MRTLTLLLLALGLRAQTITLVDSPLEACIGDSIQLALSNKPDPSGTKEWIFLASKAQNQVKKDTIWTLWYNYIYKLKKVAVSPGDTLYYFKVKVPSAYLGPVAFTVDNSTRNVIVKNCNLVGITEHNPSEQQPIYYNMQGTCVQPQPGMLLIEQRGTLRRKVFIQQ